MPSSGIHTFGMWFPIDVVALSKNLQVMKVWHRLAPFRITSINLKTYSMLELPAGQIKNCGIEVGNQLEFHEVWRKKEIYLSPFERDCSDRLHIPRTDESV